ncbi:MAG: 4Fe-4S dicluster domain-containing protein [Candidatus Bipolaricaulis sp.]|nr:4Fe-4S dicluster domain-containing protein [Candidatus Bipolaricaulis sp.]
MVTFAGLSLRNPIVAASATSTWSVSSMLRAENAGAGAVVTKSVGYHSKRESRFIGHPRPRYRLVNKGVGWDPSLDKEGAFFSLYRLGEMQAPEEPEEYAEVIRAAKETLTIPVVVSLANVWTPPYREWAKTAKIMEKAGADALELDLSAHPMPKATDPNIVRAVRDAVDLPVIAKLMIGSEDPTEIGPQIEKAGADAICAIGTGPGLCLEVDVASEQFVLQPSFLATGGPWYRPIGLAFIARLARSVNIPLSGVTGVVTWEDAAKYILLGATTVQVCAAIYAHGYSVLGRIADGLDNYMREKGYASIEAFRGKLLGQLVPRWDDLELDPPVSAVADPQRCVLCGRCIDTCMYDAISLTRDGTSIQVDGDKCDGCSLCVSRCLTGALSMRRLDGPST